MDPFTTPLHKFTLPTTLTTDKIDSFRITYAQEPRMGARPVAVLTKTKEDCTIYGNIITTYLSQAETNKFQRNKPAQVQIHLKTTEGQVMQSRVIHLCVHDSLDTKEL